MRNFESLDTSTFKAFWVASETLNFTEAARQAAMTQSGISQHISRIERQLGVPLFLRISKKVVLTEAGKRFKSYVETYLDEVESLKEELTAESTALSGYVSYAMPESCLMSPHFGLLLEQRKQNFPELRLKVRICPSEEVIEKLVSDEVNFGFITKKILAPGVKLLPFCQEEYVLVSARKSQVSNITPDSLKDLRFIGYPGSETLFEIWVKHNLPRQKNINWSNLDVIGEIDGLKGVVEMIKQGVGVAVIPEHCVSAQISQKEFFRGRTKGGKKSLNQIYIATLDLPQLPRRVAEVIKTFMGMVK